MLIYIRYEKDEEETSGSDVDNYLAWCVETANSPTKQSFQSWQNTGIKAGKTASVRLCKM